MAAKSAAASQLAAASHQRRVMAQCQLSAAYHREKYQPAIINESVSSVMANQ